jgi:hypothetical protein
LVGVISLAPAAAQDPNTLAADQIYVRIRNAYDVTLAAMGLAGVTRAGRDSAVGILTLDATGYTYHGTLAARASGTMEARSLLGNCSDSSNATQEIYAVAHIERPSPGFLATDSVAFGTVDFDLNFFFFPNTAPEVNFPGDCQGTVGFDGYGPLFGSGGEYNEAPYDWLPQTRAPGEFIPFNDSRWTSQNGLLIHAPAAGGSLVYLERSDMRPAEQVESIWIVRVNRGPQCGLVPC